MQAGASRLISSVCDVGPNQRTVLNAQQPATDDSWRIELERLQHERVAESSATEISALHRLGEIAKVAPVPWSDQALDAVGASQAAREGATGWIDLATEAGLDGRRLRLQLGRRNTEAVLSGSSAERVAGRNGRFPTGRDRSAAACSRRRHRG